MGQAGFLPKPKEFSMKRFVSPLIVLLGFAGQAFGQAADELAHKAFSDWNYHNNAGWRAVTREQFDSAERHFRAAVIVIRPHDADDPRLLAHSYNDLAWVLHKQGRSREAQPLADWALKIREVKVGPSAEATAQTLFVLGSIEAELGHLDQAETCFARTLAIHEARYGANSSSVTAALIDLAGAQSARRKFSQAETAFNRVLDTPSRFLADDDPNRALALTGLADLEKTKGETDKAVEHLRKAIAIHERISPPDSAIRLKLNQKLQGLLNQEKSPQAKPSSGTK